MACSMEYRQFAEQQVNAALTAELPLVRKRHLEAAERWKQLADEMERFELPTMRRRPQEVFY